MAVLNSGDQILSISAMTDNHGCIEQWKSNSVQICHDRQPWLYRTMEIKYCPLSAIADNHGTMVMFDDMICNCKSPSSHMTSCHCLHVEVIVLSANQNADVLNISQYHQFLSNNAHHFLTNG